MDHSEKIVDAKNVTGVPINAFTGSDGKIYLGNSFTGELVVCPCGAHFLTFENEQDAFEFAGELNADLLLSALLGSLFN